MEIVIICLVTLLLGGGTLKTLEHFFGPQAIPTKYDPHYTRKRETEVYGYPITVCDDDGCRECFPKALVKSPAIEFKCKACRVAAVSKPGSYCLFCFPKNPNVVAKKNSSKCIICLCWINDDSDGICKPCANIRTKNEIRAAFENKINSYPRPIPLPEPRTRVIAGRLVNIPDGVPSNAFVREEYDPNMLRDTGYLIWQWVDTETGKTMYMKSISPLRVEPIEYDYFDIHSNQQAKPIGTERVRK